MRRGEVDLGVVGDQRLLRTEVLDPHPRDRAVRSRVAQCAQVRLAQGTLPHERLVAHPPGVVAPLRPLAGLGEAQRDPANVVEASHWMTRARPGAPTPHAPGAARPAAASPARGTRRACRATDPGTGSSGRPAPRRSAGTARW